MPRAIPGKMWSNHHIKWLDTKKLKSHRSSFNRLIHTKARMVRLFPVHPLPLMSMARLIFEHYMNIFISMNWRGITISISLFIRFSLSISNADSIHCISCGLNDVGADSIHLIGCSLNAVNADSIHHIGYGFNAVSAALIHLQYIITLSWNI